jgi:large subunit ribosomal protein L35
MLRLRTTRPLGRAFTRLNGTVAPTEAASTPEAPSPPPPAASASKEAATPAAPKTADTKATDTTTTTAATSTAEATGEADADAEATDKPTTRGRRGPRPHRRSLAALGKTAGWNRPLAPGVLPAYDEALKLLRADSRTLKTELEGVQKKLEGLNGKEGEALRKKANILEVQSEINLPDVRWKARNGQGEPYFYGYVSCF